MRILCGVLGRSEAKMQMMLIVEVMVVSSSDDAVDDVVDGWWKVAADRVYM